MNDVQDQGESSVSPVQTINISNTNSRRNPLVSRSGRQAIQPRRSPGLLLFNRQRKQFITKVYLLATVFIALTLIQWISLISNPVLADFFRERYYIPLIAGLTALLFITFFALIYEIRYIQPYNWIFGYLIVELETLGLLQSVLEIELSHLGMCFLVTSILNGIFILIGIMVPKDLTQDIMILFVISLFFYIAASIVLIFLIITQMYQLKLFLIFGSIVLVLMYIVYVTQLIMGNRAGSLRWNDIVLAALLVYFNFMLILGSILNLTNEMLY